MRNIPPRILVLSAFFAAAVVSTAIVPVVAPAMADPDSPATFRAEFERIKQEMRELQLELQGFHPLPKYCLPPIDPMKAPHNSAMQVFDARTRALVARYVALKQSLSAFLAGNYRFETEFMVDGLTPRDRLYWKNSPYELEKDRLQKKFNEKDAELRAKPERNCNPPAPPKKEIEVIGGNPPIQPPPPPPPPPPPVDPLKGLTRPVFEAVNLPLLADHYCSQAEKNAVLAKIPPEIAKAEAQIAEIDAYIASVRARRVELEKRGVESHWLDSMDYEVHQAEIIRNDRRTTIESINTTRHLIETTPIVDCTKDKKEIGSIGGGWSVGIEGGYGDLKIPFKPYLSLEVGGDQRLGVVQLSRNDNYGYGSIYFGREFNCDQMPVIEITPAMRRSWRAYGEGSRYNFDLNAFNEGVSTTTEGVGIPGTGDPMSTYPAGVFLANPAFNDVTDIRYRHTSDFEGLKLGLDQNSFYKGWSATLGTGFEYGRLETQDILSGSITGYPENFRYQTDIETRDFKVFLKAGAEVGLDDFWEQSLRYAGEFSGFRLGATVQGGFNFLDAEGLDRLDLSGVAPDSQRVRISKDDTTFGYQLGAHLSYTPPGIGALNLSVGVEYGEDDIHPVPTRSGETDDKTRIEFETQETTTGFFRTRFQF